MNDSVIMQVAWKHPSTLKVKVLSYILPLFTSKSPAFKLLIIINVYDPTIKIKALILHKTGPGESYIILMDVNSDVSMFEDVTVVAAQSGVSFNSTSLINKSTV